MRGKVQLYKFALENDRITPAYAGKSSFKALSTISTKDHPRLCGEKIHINFHFVSPLRITPAYAGKSSSAQFKMNRCRDHPRLCGEKPPIPVGNLNANRITPAYAGKSWNEQAAKCAERDHPRLCGEKSIFYHLLSILLGSPPPMRGKDSACSSVNFSYRITPAYAGKRYPICEKCDI